MIQGLFYALAAGVFVSLNNVFVSRAGAKLGFWEANTLVHGMCFLLALVILFLTGRTNTGALRDLNYIYLIGCFSGVMVLFTIMQGVVRLGVIFAVPLIIGAQILGSMVISRFGLFEEKIVIPSFTNIVGFILVLVGVVLSQLRP